MRIVCWNCRRGRKASGVWDYLLRLEPDVALLQEVGTIPAALGEVFQWQSRIARGKTGKEQKFGTAVLVKGKVIAEHPVLSKSSWINGELEALVHGRRLDR